MLVIQAVLKIAGHSPGAFTNNEPGNLPQSLCVDFHWLGRCSGGVVHNEVIITGKMRHKSGQRSSRNVSRSRNFNGSRLVPTIIFENHLVSVV